MSVPAHLIPDPTELGTTPATVRLLPRLADDERVQAADIVRLCESDPAVTARLLSIANSARYAIGRSIRGPEEATLRLGLLPARDLVLECVAGRLLADAPSSLHLEARQVAAAARLIARQGAPIGHGAAVSAALLHNLGRWLLLRSRVVDVDGLWLAPADPSTDRAQEIDRLGWSQAQVGAAALRAWSIPEDLARAVEGHDDPSLLQVERCTSRDRLSLVLGTGRRLLASSRGVRPDPEDDAEVIAALAWLGLTWDRMLRLFAAWRHEVPPVRRKHAA
jgi:HD-like signal output (HDOD) protein